MLQRHRGGAVSLGRGHVCRARPEHHQSADWNHFCHSGNHHTNPVHCGHQVRRFSTCLLWCWRRYASWTLCAEMMLTGLCVCSLDSLCFRPAPWLSSFPHRPSLVWIAGAAPARVILMPCQSVKLVECRR